MSLYEGPLEPFGALRCIILVNALRRCRQVSVTKQLVIIRLRSTVVVYLRFQFPILCMYICMYVSGYLCILHHNGIARRTLRRYCTQNVNLLTVLAKCPRQRRPNTPELRRSSSGESPVVPSSFHRESRNDRSIDRRGKNEDFGQSADVCLTIV
jgi:hypothetical protein